MMKDTSQPGSIRSRRRRSTAGNTSQDAITSTSPDNSSQARPNTYLSSSSSSLLPVMDDRFLESKDKSKRQWNLWSRYDSDHARQIVGGIFLLVLFFITGKYDQYFDNDNLPLLIPYLHVHEDDTSTDDNYHDLGGWLIGGGSRSTHRNLEEVLDHYQSLKKYATSNLKDTNGIIVLPLIDSKFQRSIRENDHDLQEIERESYLVKMDNAEYISKRHWYEDELEDIYPRSDGCRRQAWEKEHHPNCLHFHEVDLSRNFDKVLAQRPGDVQDAESFYLSHGWFRDVFALYQPGFQNASKAVLKVARYTKHEMNYRPLYNAKRDALIMERLSGASNIIDIYGHCGSSVMVESMPHEMEEKIVPGGGWINPDHLNDEKDVDVQNTFSVEQKLSLLLEMAESIAELHGYKDGVIVHDDIQLCQWLRNDKGKLKLGDFNRARVLNWNDEKQEYCAYSNGRGYGNYRSPEEYGEKPLLQTHDVWSMGNNIYAMMTGLWPFYAYEDDEVVSGKIINHTTAFIDPRYRTRSYGEGQMVKLIERCWVQDMKKRADIFEVVDTLKKTIAENNRRIADKKKRP